jgi:hypothetical protein
LREEINGHMRRLENWGFWMLFFRQGKRLMIKKCNL